jgi:hypothetical protein
VILALVAAAAAAQPAPPSTGTLGEIRMHLFYKESGRLSRDISPPNEFVGWNTIISEGDAEEAADDLLVVVELRAAGEQNLDRPLRIEVRNRSGRTIGRRDIAGTLTSGDGRAYHPLLLQDVGCEGTMRVTASFGAESRTEEIALNCGE